MQQVGGEFNTTHENMCGNRNNREFLLLNLSLYVNCQIKNINRNIEISVIYLFKRNRRNIEPSQKLRKSRMAEKTVVVYGIDHLGPTTTNKYSQG